LILPFLTIGVDHFFGGRPANTQADGSGLV
jgi:hypothetical protein